MNSKSNYIEIVKPSAYNYICKWDEIVVIYNFLYKNMAAYTISEWNGPIHLEQSISHESPHNSIYSLSSIFEAVRLERSVVPDDLIENNFFISQDFNELDYIKFNYRKSLYNASHFRNVLLPTLLCNLKCPYCYEEKHASTMNMETARKYIQWVEPFLQLAKAFSLDFFGGEPLVNMDVIRFISKAIIDLQKKYRFEYRASLTTNGYLINRELIKEFDELKIESVQVSFDGDKFFHDKTRKSILGNGTFDTLLENIEAYCAFSKSRLPLFIRINVTDENYESVSSLLDKFSACVKERSIIYFRWIYENSASNFQPFSMERRGSLPFENLAPLYNLAINKGFHTNTLSEEPSYSYCECDFASFFTIDPEGYIYQCTHTFNPKGAIGHVEDGVTSPSKLAEYFSIVNQEPFEDTECLQCILLPTCKGGCRKSRYYGHKICIDFKDSLEKYVKMIYNKNKV